MTGMDQMAARAALDNGIGCSLKDFMVSSCRIGWCAILLLMSVMLMVLMGSVTQAQDFYKESNAEGWYWTAMDDYRWHDNLTSATGSKVEVYQVNYVSSLGFVRAIAEAPDYGVHKVTARVYADLDVACADAQAWTYMGEMWRFGRNIPSSPSDGVVNICYNIRGDVTTHGTGLVNLQFYASLGGLEIAEIYEEYTSSQSGGRTICGIAYYTIGEPIDYYESVFVGAYAGPGCERNVLILDATAYGDYSKTINMVSLTPSEGHYLEWTASGATYPPVLPLAASVNQGTIGTQIIIEGSGFGDKKGKVLIGGAALKIAKNGWSDSSITGTVNKALPPAPYTLTIAPKGEPSFNYTDTFTMTSPITSTVTPEQAAVGTEVLVEGSFFGAKKGKVYLEDNNGKQNKCKVTEWYMDPPTGASRLKFIVPTKLTSGSYTLGITNKVGAITTPFTVD